MKKLFALLLLFVVTGCTGEKDLTSEFEFILSYGVMYKNVLNTIEDSFTKDLVIDGEVTTDLVLTEEEKKRIYLKMKDINLFQYSNEVEGMNMEPQSGYKFELFVDGKVKRVNWIGEFNESETHKEFRDLIKMITEIIESKEAFKSLPKPNGYYE